MKIDDKDIDQSNDPVSNLLREAAPRQSAPVDARKRAFDQLHAHWANNVAKRKRSQRSLWMGIAATLVIGLGLITVLNTNNTASISGAIVANVSRVEGVVLISEIAQDDAIRNLASSDSIREGDTLKTTDSSRIAIAWGDTGSLRLANNTQVTVDSLAQITLNAGEVYYDSKAQPFGSDTRTTLTINTPYGLVSHNGTQFLTSLDDAALTIRVREGEVEIEQRGAHWKSEAGEALSISASGEAERFAVSSRGKDWDWVHSIAPAYNAEGRSAHALLQWIGRELGYKVVFSDNLTSQQSERSMLTGLSPLSPSAALEALPIATSLEYDLKEDVIFISRQ